MFEFVRAQTAQSGRRDSQTITVTRGVLEPKMLLPRTHMLRKKFLKKEQIENFASQNASNVFELGRHLPTRLGGVYIKIEPRDQRLARTLAPPVSPLPSTDWLGSVGRP